MHHALKFIRLHTGPTGVHFSMYISTNSTRISSYKPVAHGNKRTELKTWTFLKTISRNRMHAINMKAKRYAWIAIRYQMIHLQLLCCVLLWTSTVVGRTNRKRWPGDNSAKFYILQWGRYTWPMYGVCVRMYVSQYWFACMIRNSWVTDCAERYIILRESAVNIPSRKVPQ